MSASGKITQFALELETVLGSLSIGFEHFAVKLGPPKPKKKDKEKEEPKTDQDTDPAPAEREKSVEAEIDFEMSEIKATGVLLFLIKLIQIAAHLPRVPELSGGEESSVYPAKLPGAGDADISVTVGPIEWPKFKWLGFEVTNVAASVGIGLFFFPRQPKGSGPPEVPANLFAIRIASADRPLTLLAAPWGGLAHVGFNFTPHGMAGFQACLGIVYRTRFELGPAKGTCEGSLAGVFTYLAGEHGPPSYQFDLVLNLKGHAIIAGFIDIHLALVAAGSWQDGQWFFHAEISARVKISFFTIRVRFSFNYRLADAGGGDQWLTGPTATPDRAQTTESEWLAYRAAFAQEA